MKINRTKTKLLSVFSVFAIALAFAIGGFSRVRLEVSATTQDIAFQESEMTISYGDIRTNPVNNIVSGELTYSSSDTNVATVNSQTGEVYGLNLGTTTITATVPATGDYDETVISYELTVTKRPVAVSSVQVYGKSFDGTTNATIDEIELGNLVGTDQLYLDADYTATGVYDNPNVGNDKTVTITLTMLDTSRTEKYEFANSEIMVTSSITPYVLYAQGVTLPTTEFTYTGEPIYPTVNVVANVYGGVTTLVEGQDYTVVYPTDAVNVGTKSLVIKGINNYGSQVSKSYAVVKAASGQPDEVNGLEAVSGMTLAEIPGERSAGFSWVNPDEIVMTGLNEYPATYVQNGDTTNYLPVDVNVRVYGLALVDITTEVLGNVGGTITPSIIDAVEGSVVEIVFSADEGYMLTSVRVDGIERYDFVDGDRMLLTVGDSDMSVVAEYSKLYEVTSGADQTVTLGDAATFVINAAFEKFEAAGNVYVDRTLVTADNYTAQAGSTVIILNADYVKTLSAGEHELIVNFGDGVARTMFTIIDPEVTTPDTGAFTGEKGIVTGVIILPAILGLIGGIAFMKRRGHKVTFDKH